MIWDRDVQEKWRPLSVQSVNEIAVGDVLYGHWDGGRKIAAILTHAEECERVGLAFYDEKTQWIRFDDDRESSATRDMCMDIERPYNAWLVFKVEEDAKDYYAEVNLSHDHDDYDYDDYDYDWREDARDYYEPDENSD